MFASTNILMITTCTGAVYVLSQDSFTRGDGGIGSDAQWSRVMQNATTPLSNVIVARGTLEVGFALKSDGTIWTWGKNTNLGNGTALISTTDFFMPLVDDPYEFGRIASANAISDVYAMGGKPVLAIAILGWPINILPPAIAQKVITVNPNPPAKSITHEIMTVC